MDHPWTLATFRLLRYSLRILWGFFLDSCVFVRVDYNLREKKKGKLCLIFICTYLSVVSD